MPDWLRDTLQAEVEVAASLLIFRLATALVLGCLVAGIYRATHGQGRNEAVGLTATLVLLTVLIAMVTLVIGNSVARAFSLVGALSIVRFRTVVEDTRDTAFVIFAVAVGMAVGAGFLMVPLAGIPFAALAAFLFRPRSATGIGASCYTLVVRIGAGQVPGELLRETFDKHLQSAQLTATATARQGAALDLTYRVSLRREGEAVALVSDLNGLAGVQEVTLRQA
jgi:hypothetical protein